MSFFVNPVKVRLCFGREKPGGPMGPGVSETGKEVEGRRSLEVTVLVDIVAVGSGCDMK